MNQVTHVNNHIQYSYIEYDKQDLNKASYTNYEESSIPMMITDIMEFCRENGISIDKMVVITDFRVQPNYRNKGIGRKGIRETVATLKYMGYKLIIFNSAIMKLDHPDEPSERTFLNTMAEQGYFLEKNGFKNVNALCCLEWCIPYVYVDSDSKEFVKEFIKLEISRE